VGLAARTDRPATHSAGEPGLLVVGGHVQRVDEELDRLVDAVLIVEAEAAHVERVPIGGVHAQDVTKVKEDDR